VADLDAFGAHKNLDRGCSTHTWRSGVKHDAGAIMEFSRDGHKLMNGLGKPVDIEEDYVFPLLKSSDLGNGRTTIRKSVLVTQKHTGDDTADILERAPKTWRYLTRHAGVLDNRKSSIYENRPRFSIFGIGQYSFSLWKIAISGLYKNISFVIVPPCGDRPVMVDDTCYFITCKSKTEAEFLHGLLASKVANEFLKSLIFLDSKRPITADVLKRISFVELARELGRLEKLRQVLRTESVTEEDTPQLSLLMESKQEYRIRDSNKAAPKRQAVMSKTGPNHGVSTRIRRSLVPSP
jgi:hypothetical protein